MNIKYIKTTDNTKYDLRDKRITDTDTGIATQSANGLLSSGDKKKLDGIASGAEVNQNAFSNIKIGNTTISADSKTDTVELTAGNNITLTPDATNDKITIAATDTNTTYTFKGGTNQFTVTPSNGTAQTVSVTPSIANNVTGSDLTANTIILGNGNSGVKKSGKTIVTTLGSDDTTLPTSKAVKAAIDALPEPMIFKGTLGTGGTITSLPAAAASNNGFTYKVITDGTYASQSAKIGDMFISNGSSWNLIPSGDEPSGTVTNIATGTGLTGGPITSSGTISHADTSSQASVSNSGRTYILSITLDSMGHVTGITSATETVTNTDTKVTQRLYTGNGIMPLLFATEQCGYPTDITDIAYRNNSIYVLPSQGYVFANRFMGNLEGNVFGTAHMAHQLENTTSVGSATQPVYFEQGVPTACSYQLNKTVPSNAVFTDTDTKVTSAANHYAPSTVSGQDKSASASGGTAGWSIDVVKGVTLNTDGKGHVTGLSVTSAKIPANPVSPNTVTGPASSTDAHVAVFNGATGKAIKDSGFTIAKSVPSNAVFTDVAVLQRLASSYLDLPLLMAVQTTSNTTGDIYGFTYRNNSIYANPATGTITANKFNGSSTHAYTSSQSGFVENHGDNLEHYWMKLWEIDVNARYVDRDITFLLQSAFQERQGTLHIRIRRDSVGGSSGYFIASMRLTSGNIDKTRVRLYYNNSTGNCQLWYDCGEIWGCINAKMLHKTLRNSGEVPTLGTMYSTSTTTVQELPGTGYKYVEPTYAVYAEWNDVQNKPSSDAGSATQPVYFSGGVPIACSYQLNKTVPSNAVFTDTHYTTHLYAGSGTAANAATTNGNTKLTVVDNTTPRKSVTIKGTGGTTVSSDANGVVTINSMDASSKQFTFPYPVKEDDSYYFIISPKGNATITPDSTCYFVEITALINNGTDSFVTRSAKFMTHCYWFTQNSGLRITNPVYNTRYTSNCPILYHDKAQGADVGTETYNHNVCNIPFKLTIETGLMSVNIRVEGPDVSECTCSRSYTSFKWPAVEPDWSIV